MPTPSYVLLEKITVGASGASSVTFNSIPQTGYTDLVVKVSARVDAAANYQSVAMAFNGGSPASAFSQRWINGDGSTASSGSYGANTILYPMYAPGSSATSSTFGNGEIYICNYSSTSQYKSISIDAVTENNATGARAELGAMLWSSNNAVTSITLYGNTNFVANSTFYLYGVAKLGTTPAIQPYATGGDTIMTDGTYWYHAFKSSGTFTPAKGLSCDVLVVAGGGGGSGGGGGAGGLYYSTANSIATAQTVTIGAGGAAGANGNNSVFGSLTAAVAGGYGGGYNESTTLPNPSGGSGGGGGAKWNTSLYNQPGGIATSGQGNNGGNGLSQGGTGVSNVNGGGGGGAGGAGTNATTGQGGAGGAGTNTYSTWLNTTGTGVSGYIAGGGGGGSYNSAGAGGSGGGGAGSVNGGIAGTANTGSGGGGGYNGGGGTQAGGSGLVIVRYAV